jgi:hypothetical protein
MQLVPHTVHYMNLTACELSCTYSIGAYRACTWLHGNVELPQKFLSAFPHCELEPVYRLYFKRHCCKQSLDQAHSYSFLHPSKCPLEFLEVGGLGKCLWTE